jgi:hypothetical protein
MSYEAWAIFIAMQQGKAKLIIVSQQQARQVLRVIEKRRAA